MKNETKGKIITGFGYGIAGAAPLIATASQFPVLVEKGPKTTISGVFILMCIIVALPMVIYVKKLQTANQKVVKPPNALSVWGLLLIGCFAMENIIAQFKIIAIAGLSGTGVAELMFMWAKKVALTPDQEKELKEKTGKDKDTIVKEGEKVIEEVLNEGEQQT